MGSMYFDIEYNDIFFTQDNFVIYNETECVIMTFDGVEKYNPENMGSEEKPSVVFVPMGDKGFGFSVKPGESITYKAVIKVPKDYINSNVVFFERLNRKYASNSDFAIKLFSEQEER